MNKSHNKKVENLTGKKFGKLTVLKKADSKKVKLKTLHFWLCLCDCGITTKVETYKLKSGHTKSCGHLRAEKMRELTKTHGQTKSREYRSWTNMINRCTNVKGVHFKWYGGRGIKVCKRWLKFENFFEDMGFRPEGMSLDRIDNNGDYCKENCKWSTHSEQCNNRGNHILITYKEKTQTLARWSKELNIPYGLMYRGFMNKLPIKDILSSRLKLTLKNE